MATDNFQDAAVRHYHDAKRLAAGGRFQNAGYLIGLAAECLVKTMLERDGKIIDKKSVFRCHFPKLAGVVGRLGQGPNMRLLAPVVARGDFLSEWDVERRYAAELPAAAEEQRFAAWRSDVSNLFNAAGLP